jgi:V-type H+-transporting ATPase subunit a
MFLSVINKLRRVRKKAANLFFEDIEIDIDRKAKFVEEQINKEKELHNSFNNLIIYKQVIKIAWSLVKDMNKMQGELKFETRINEKTSNYFTQGSAAMSLFHEDDSGLDSICGTIKYGEKEVFRRILFRATRGNSLLYLHDINFPILDFDGNETWISVYVIIFPQGPALKEKIIKMCDSFLSNRFDIPHENYIEKVEAITQRIQETKILVNTTEEEVTKYLFHINSLEDSTLSAIQVYKWFIVKELCLYDALNRLKP